MYIWDADYPWDVRVEKTCLALTAAGHDVHIVARNRRWSPTIEHLPEGTVHRMPPWRWAGQRADDALGFPAFFSPRWRRLIANTVKEVSAHLIIARDLPLCPTAIQIGRNFGIPVILDMAENYPAMMRAIWETGRDRPADYIVRNPKFVDAVERYCLQHLDHVIAVVEESAERLYRLGVPRSKVTVISNTPRVARAQTIPPKPRHCGEALDVVYMGNIEVARGLLESIEAIAKLRGAGHKVRLRIIGRGRDEALMRTRAAALAMGPEAVEFLGYIQSHREALELVAAADIGLLPHQKCEAWDTTIPNKLFDYMALGLPVASSDAAPCARILTETGAGQVFESGNPSSLARAIETFMDASTRERVGLRGQTAVRERYNWERDTDVLLSVVDRQATPRDRLEHD